MPMLAALAGLTRADRRTTDVGQLPRSAAYLTAPGIFHLGASLRRVNTVYNAPRRKTGLPHSTPQWDVKDI